MAKTAFNFFKHLFHKSLSFLLFLIEYAKLFLKLRDLLTSLSFSAITNIILFVPIIAICVTGDDRKSQIP